MSKPAKRKPFVWRGWKFCQTAAGGWIIHNEEVMDDSGRIVPVTVREVGPVCRHEYAKKHNLPWCRPCGAYRRETGSVSTGVGDSLRTTRFYSRWRKPRRG